MRWRCAASLALVFLVTADARAALTIADCDLAAEVQPASLSHDCAVLDTLSARYAAPRRAALPDSGALDAILRDLGHVAVPKSLWELFSGWAEAQARALLDLLPDFPNPLADLDWSWPSWLPNALLWSAGLLLAVLGLAGLLAVLREFGVLTPAVRRTLDALRPAPPEDGVPGLPTFAGLRSLPAAEQPRVLLALVVGALRAARLLPPDEALSHRQLAPAARDVTPSQRGTIDAVAGLAERVTYSAFVPDDGDLEQATGSARELVGELTR